MRPRALTGWRRHLRAVERGARSSPRSSRSTPPGSATPTASCTSERTHGCTRDEARSLPLDQGRRDGRPPTTPRSRLELRSLAERYAQGVDRRDVETFVALFHDDAVDHHPRPERERPSPASSAASSGWRRSPRSSSGTRRPSTCSASRPTTSATARPPARCTASPTTSPPTTHGGTNYVMYIRYEDTYRHRRRRRVEVRRSAGCGSTGPRPAPRTRRPARRSRWTEHSQGSVRSSSAAVRASASPRPARWRATARAVTIVGPHRAEARRRGGRRSPTRASTSRTACATRSTAPRCGTRSTPRPTTNAGSQIAVVVPGGGGITPVLLLRRRRVQRARSTRTCARCSSSSSTPGRRWSAPGGGSFVAISSTAAVFSTRYLAVVRARGRPRSTSWCASPPTSSARSASA